MAHIPFSNYSSSGFTQQECLPGKMRLSIFLLIGECVGLPAVVWVLRFLNHRYKTGSRVSVIVITLLLCDLLVLLLNPYIVTKLLQDDECWQRSMTCRLLSSLWSGSLICGLHLQQVLALETALLWRYPFHFAHDFFPSCSIAVTFISFIYFFLCEVYSVTQFILFPLPLVLVIISTSWIVTCITPPNIGDTPYRPRKPSFTILAFVTLTLTLYGVFSSTCAIVSFVHMIPFNLLVMCVSLMSLTVIIDPLLCVIIYRESTELNQTEVNP